MAFHTKTSEAYGNIRGKRNQPCNYLNRGHKSKVNICGQYGHQVMTDNLYYKTNFSNLLARVRGTRDCGQIMECYIVYLRYRTDHSHQFFLSFGLRLSSVRYSERFWAVEIKT